MLALPHLLLLMADMAVRGRRFVDASAHLRECFKVALRTGNRFDLAPGLWSCATLCSATGRHAECATVLGFIAVYDREQGFESVSPGEARRREEAVSKARRVLGGERYRIVEERGAAMSLDTVVEYALMLTDTGTPPSGTPAVPELGRLSARERELVTLVAQGHTNAQIAAQLFISVRTVGSHLDRIRDKTGCRRRADLTRLALTAGLV
jgi:DNA-binding CsgD family transcriptional regulator